MKLRFNTLFIVLLPEPKFVKKAAVFLMLFLYCPIFSQSPAGSDVKKQAEKLFEEENYAQAYKLYSQLVANYPKDVAYNFRLGVCMVYSEADKKKCLPYLQFAAKNKNDETKDVNFYLGKAYHINYLFDEAIKNYSEFKKSAPPSRQKKLQVDHEIAACGYGKKLLSNLTDLVVLSKKELNEADYFRSYDLRNIGGKLLVKPDEFKSNIDKKKNERSIVFLPKTGDRVYYSSYGENTDNGKDIFYSVKLADGTYGKPQKVNGINTEFDEDYPFLHPNGQTLYFASKGHNSMGGYDVFKSSYDIATNAWGPPVNLAFPINSPDDDYLLVTDSLEKVAFFSTGRQSPPGKVDVLKINTERKPIDILAIKGNVIKESPEQSLKSKISIKMADTKSDIGIYYAEENGDYTIELPNGARLLFTVETPGLKTQTQEIVLPFTTESRPFKQSITYADGILKITNDFDAPASEENYLQYLKVIEKKAKLDVNEGENKLVTPTDANGVAAKGTKVNGPQLVEDSTSASPTAKNTKQGLDNKQLAGIAKQDAQESKEEAARLKQDSDDALEVGNSQKIEAGKKLAAAEEALTNAKAITNAEEQKPALEKAQLLKQEAENEEVVANKILSFAQSLDADATAKRKEAELNEQYATELEKAINAKEGNKELLAKLETLQQEINNISKQKNTSENIFNLIKTDISEKEKQLAIIEKTNEDIKANLNEIKAAVAANDVELAQTKKKKEKERLANETADLKAEQTEKENQVAANEVEIKKVGDELAGLKNEMELATKIKNETIAVVPVAVNTTTSSSSLPLKEKSPALVAKTEKTNKTSQPQNATTDTKPDFTPLTANTTAEALTKLDNLTATLGVNDNEIFDFNAYQNPQAQSLKVEADTKINEASTQVKKLKETIVSSKEELAKPSTTTQNNAPSSQQLMLEADELSIKAQAVRSQSETKTDPEKDTLANQAKQLEAQADDKYIQAAAVKETDNKSVFDTNLENVKDLVSANRSSEIDQAEAKRLSAEAETAFKQSTAIREEARSLTSNGAKLGNLSNAEEIESGAIAKQQQALDILKKANPSFPLKTAVTSSSPGIAQNSSADLEAKLKAVNDGMNNLVNLKIDSYQKLYDANSSEIEEVMNNVTKHQELVDKTPRFKNEYASGSGKLAKAKELKQHSETASSPNDKLNDLAAAIKKQLEALKQLESLNAELNKSSAKEPLAKQNATPEVKPNESLPPTIVDTLAKAKVIHPDTAALNTVTIDIAALATQDTTTDQLLGYFDKTSPDLKNPQANTTLQKSLTELKSTEAEIKSVEDKIKNYQPSTTSASLSPIELITQADALLMESEQVNEKAVATRKEAGDKTGPEQDSLLAKAMGLEQQSQNKKLEASSLYRQANASDNATNTQAIRELLTKLKNDNPSLSAEGEQKNSDLLVLNDQIAKLRQEADALENPAAKLGAISNVEEKEAELIQKQNQFITELKKQYPDYVVKPLNTANETLEELTQKKNVLKEKQYTELTNLTNAFSLEFEASKNGVPQELNFGQETLKKNADNLNAESKRLLLSASQQSDGKEKMKLLTLSARAGSAAVEQLNKLVSGKSVAAAKSSKTVTKELEKIGTDLANNNPPVKRKTKPRPTAVPKNRANAKGIVKLEGLEVTKGNAYSDARPIPLDAEMDSGLVFRVQIGAFKTRLANNAFRGLSPLNGESTKTGYIRYTAGNFNKVENANAVKNDLRRLGYNDAFVVIYYRGKRISLAEALSMMERQGKTIDANAPQTAGITAEANLPKVTAPVQTPNINIKEEVVIAKELEQINGLLYTIQIGVYNKQITTRQLLNLKPIFTERLNNGLFRYTAGIYNSPDRLLNDKRKVVDLGVKDAFVSAYLNGKRIPFGDGKTRQAEDSTIKMETENPIQFPNGFATSEQSSGETGGPLNVTTTPSVQPFRNNVTGYPNPSPENGVKTNEQGVTFKVQIGAFSKQVPTELASKFLAITTWPVENKQINGLFIYNIGNFSDVKFAKTLKEEALKLGIPDAFVTVYKNGIKLYGAEAAEAIKQ